MAGTILVREAMRRISRLLQDANPQFKNLPEQEAVDFLNDAHIAIAKVLPSAASRSDAIRLRPGSLQSIEVIAPADCKPSSGATQVGEVRGIELLGITHNMGTDGLTEGRSIRIIDQKTMDAMDPDWRTKARASGVVRSYIYSPTLPLQFAVEPPVHAVAPVWVQAQINALPARILNTGSVGGELYAEGGASTAVIQVRDEFIDELVNYVVARANMKDAEWSDSNKAANFAGMWLNSMNAKVTAATGANPNLKRLPFAPSPTAAAS